MVYEVIQEAHLGRYTVLHNGRKLISYYYDSDKSLLEAQESAYLYKELMERD